MPPKDKAKQKEREKIAIDKTFGMKNKNKSKAVQKYIKSITNNAKGAPRGGLEEAERKEKEAKQKEIQKAALMNSLFNMGTDKKGRAFDPIAKKAAKQAEEEAIAAGRKLKEEVKKEIIEGIANSIRLTNPKGIRMSELGGHPIITALKDKHVDVFKNISLLLFIKANSKVFWVDDEDSNPMLRCQEDVDAEVAPDERPIEEIIEERRAALPPGGTPVTLETFKAWKAKREAERLAQVEEDMKKASSKAGGSKGLTGLSGRDLFTYDASLFVDDDGAASADEYDERSEAEEEEEELRPGMAGDAAESGEEGASEDEAEEEEVEAEGTGEGAEGDREARSSGEDGGFHFKPAPREVQKDEGKVAINEQLFLEGGDLPDDLDDLEEEEQQKGK